MIAGMDPGGTLVAGPEVERPAGRVIGTGFAQPQLKQEALYSMLFKLHRGQTHRCLSIDIDSRSKRPGGNPAPKNPFGSATTRTFLDRSLKVI